VTSHVETQPTLKESVDVVCWSCPDYRSVLGSDRTQPKADVTALFRSAI